MTDGEQGGRLTELQGRVEEFQALTPEERAERVRAALGAMDGEALGRTATAVAQFLIQIHRENPDLIEELDPAIRQATKATDFGKLREGIVALSDYRTEATLRFLDLALGNPVVVANLFGLLPPLTNNLIKLLSRALGGVDLPAEILASSLFNTLDDLDREELGRLIDNAARMINAVHEGNLVLGRDEPRFRTVFAEFAEGIMEQVDGREATRAFAALSENLDVMLGVATDLLPRDPEPLRLVVSAKVTLVNVLLRRFAGFLAALSELPDETLRNLGDLLQKELETQEVGRAVNAYLDLVGRFRALNPDLFKDQVGRAIAAVDLEKLSETLGAASRTLAEAALEIPDVKRALEPEEVGRKVNGALARFNRYLEARPDAGRDYLTRMFAAIDARELERAARGAVDVFLGGLFASGAAAMALVRAAARAGWKLAGFLASSLKRRVFG